MSRSRALFILKVAKQQFNTFSRNELSHKKLLEHRKTAEFGEQIKLLNKGTGILNEVQILVYTGISSITNKSRHKLTF